jgi:uncharacterized repeat protein (TIGR01451 family)
MAAITTYKESLRRRAGVFVLLLFACASMWAFAASQARAAQVVNNATCDYQTQMDVAMPQESATATLTVSSPVVNVAISATDVVWAGDNIEYTITASNPGSDPLSAVTLKDALPSGTTFVSADSSGAYASGSVTWTVGSLAPGSSSTVHLTVAVDKHTANNAVIPDTVRVSCGEGATGTGTGTTMVKARTPGVVVFTDSSYNRVYSYNLGDVTYIKVTDADRNIDPAAIDTITVTVYHYTVLPGGSRSVDDQEQVTCSETGPDTGVFVGNLPTNSGPASTGDGILSIQPSTPVEVIYTDPKDAVPSHDDNVLVDPLGTVFDTASGLPVAGAVVTLIDDSTGMPAALPLTPFLVAQSNPVTTGGDGKFQFQYLNAGSYHFKVEPGGSYTFPSKVPTAKLPPGYTLGDGSRGKSFTLTAGMSPVTFDIPVDPPKAALGITKTADKGTVSIGDVVHYTVTVTNGGMTALSNVQVRDAMPHDVPYVKGSTLIGGVEAADPDQAGASLVWRIGALAAGKTAELRYSAIVGPDSMKGDGVNVAYAVAGASVSMRASYKLTISEGVFTSKGTIIGRVFLDKNGDGFMQEGEKGLGGAVLYLENGARVITDKDGKYSIPYVDPGTHVLKVDTLSLPGGASLVPTSNRSMGDGGSQFVYMNPSGLVRADFAVVAPAAAAGDGTGTGDSAGSAPAPAGATPAPGAPAADKPSSDESMAEQIKGFTADLEILAPKEGEIVTKGAVKVIVKAASSREVLLTVNGEPVSRKRVGETIVDKENHVTVYEYIGVKVGETGTTVIKAETKDPFGNIRETKEVTVAAPVKPAKLLVSPDKSDVPADGVSKLHVSVTALDANGQPARPSTFITIVTTRGEVVQKDMDLAQGGVQIPYLEKGAEFDILSPRSTGEATVSVSVEGITETFKVFFSPPKRPIMMAGVGEIKVGYGSAGGSFSPLSMDGWFDKGAFSQERGAFFVKGNLFDDLYITAAYDSGKKKTPDLQNAAATDYLADNKYQIYGDESKLGYEAKSADKLYVKLEKDRSYLLYGDYDTGFDDVKLAAYKRTLTGIQADISPVSSLRVRGFASYTDQTQVIDALPGLGISGYYYLSQAPIVEGSEQVRIETRDRLRPDIVLDRQTLSRGSDYYIDTEMGTILFKAPVPSFDANMNPVYIIVVYESIRNGAKHYIYGGRATVSPLPWIRAGATGAVEEQDSGDYRLAGSDLQLKLPYNTDLKAEFASTDSMLAATDGILSRRQGSAYAVDLLSTPLKNFKISGYYHQADDDFNNPSATDVFRGTTKYGGEASYEPWERVVFRMKAFSDNDKLNAMTDSLVSLGAEMKFSRFKLTVELERETSNTKYVPPTDPNSRLPFDSSPYVWQKFAGLGITLSAKLFPKLDLDVSHKQDLVSGKDFSTSAGLKYQLSDISKLYVREEYLKTEIRGEARTVVGAETQLMKGVSGYSEYRLDDGADGNRNQQVIGIKNTFKLTDKLNGSASVEYLRTLSGPQIESQADSVAATAGLEYLVREDLKATGRVEYRHELAATGKDDYLIEQGTAYRLAQSMTLLFQERFSREDIGTGGKHTTNVTSVSGAYRPVDDDRLDGFLKLEYKYDDNSSLTDSLKTSSLITSTEWCLQASRRLQLTGKYAGKLTGDGDINSYTQLFGAGVLYDVTNRVDVGLEYRLMNDTAAGSLLNGGSAEVGYRVIKNLWFSVGYSFDRFDADLKEDSYWGQGPYFRLRVKVDENTLKTKL